MSPWIAIASGALDLRARKDITTERGVLLLPVTPSEPVVVQGAAAELWSTLVGGGRSDDDLSAAERRLVREFVSYGIASEDVTHQDHITTLREPWLTSAMHEMAYALVASVARRNDIPLIFIKGPVQHAQGLRTREHSGDIDVWVPTRYRKPLGDLLAEWGWTPFSTAFTGTPVTHSQTLRAGEWGCDIDVHTRFPGMTIPDDEAFAVMESLSQTWSFAGVQALVPTPPSNAVIRALHDVRPRPAHPVEWRNHHEAARVLRLVGPETIGVARRTGSLAALSEALQLAFPNQQIDTSGYALPIEWHRLSSASRAESHRRALREVPLRLKPVVLYRLIWPDATTALAYMANRGLPQTTTFRARLHRLCDGVKALL